MKIKIKKIMTHAGVFHADELLAIALLRKCLGNSPIIERKFNISEEEFNDPEILVLDIGGRYQPELGNYDHHQDSSLPATNMLILRHIFNNYKMREKLATNLFAYVSDVDRGIIPNGGGGIPTINAIVRNFNSIDGGFEIALNLVDTILSGYIAAAEAEIKGEELWANLPRFCSGKCVIAPQGAKIPNWGKLAEKDGVLFLISPNERAGWQITSYNSEVIQIPKTEQQTFRHNSGFMAVYASKEEAFNHAAYLIKTTNNMKQILN